jgi:N-acetyltransferase
LTVLSWARQVVRFITLASAIAQPVGSTNYFSIDRHHRCVEIGGTWFPAAWQKFPINTETKHLQLCHAFESLGCIRVDCKTHALNTKWRQAQEGIGAIEDGTFRHHGLMLGGRIYPSVSCSIARDEWPGVKVHRDGLLSPPPPSSAGCPPAQPGRWKA